MAPIPHCSNIRNVAFIMGNEAPSRSIRAAVKICQQCPLLKRCALEALEAGNTLDGSVKAPASGVIVAGVVATGDRRTAAELSRVAGVKVPEVRAQTPRATPPKECRACQTPMHPWTRTPEVIPTGHVMHRGRGICVHCRTAYNADLKAHGHRKPPSLKQADRVRTHSTTRRAREAREALQDAERNGYDLTVQEAAAFAGVDPETIRKRVKDGRLAGWTHARVQGYRVRSTDVAELYGMHVPTSAWKPR